MVPLVFVFIASGDEVFLALGAGKLYEILEVQDITPLRHYSGIPTSWSEFSLGTSSMAVGNVGV